jgi:DNA-binding Xre family transcriptional regulator
MVEAKFIDDKTIEIIAQDGEKLTWTTYFPIRKQSQDHYIERLVYNYEKYYKDNMGETTGMSMFYWVWNQLNYYEGIGIASLKAEKDEERNLLNNERVRIGARIRELRKEKNIEAKQLAQIANIDAANLSRIEQGRYSVGIDILSKVVLALGAKIELVDFIEPKKS